MIRNIFRCFFSRKIIKKGLQKVQDKVYGKEMDYEIPYAIDMDSFNYVDGLDLIDIKISSVINDNQGYSRKKFKELYNNNDQKCLEMLREQQEMHIKNIDSSFQSSQKLSSFLWFKKNMNIKFRKYDQLLIDIDNYLQIVSHSNLNKEYLQSYYLQAYNKYIIVLMLSDHDRLYTLLMEQDKKDEIIKKRRKTVQKKKIYEDALITFLEVDQKCKIAKEQQNNYQLYFQSLFLQINALLVLGLIQQAFSKLSSILQGNYHENHRQEAYLLILTILTYQSQSNQNNSSLNNVFSEQLQYKIQTLQALNEEQCSKLHLYQIPAQICHKMLEKLSMKRYNKPITNLSIRQIKRYNRILCLLCESYYLQGKLQEAQELITILQKIMQPQTQILLNYIKMAIFFDLKDHETVIQIFQEVLSKQTINKERGSQQFYSHKLINSDIVRVKIYEMVGKLYRQMGQQDKAEEIQDEMIGLATTLSIYQLKQPELDELELKQNWRRLIQNKIPYYYLQLKISEHFRIDWIKFQEIS